MRESALELQYAPFTIVRDRREKAPWYFHDIEQRKRDGGGHLVVESVVRTIRTGDYTIDGLEKCLSIERKSVADLVRCVCGKDLRRCVGGGGAQCADRGCRAAARGGARYEGTGRAVVNATTGTEQCDQPARRRGTQGAARRTRGRGAGAVGLQKTIQKKSQNQKME